MTRVSPRLRRVLRIANRPPLDLMRRTVTKIASYMRGVWPTFIVQAYANNDAIRDVIWWDLA